ncbi:proteasome regulatory particle subunit [Vermiconidia calcicola]|uniref:Proteasome regulatory particle subunit n=1 Tax=Vermiconidia calcicola TaxID=1690605 RepID=A0ACC3MM99_9PEZI|nr:proteasome regulatory particle subunit [Vermiconidia calcicola]
MGEPQYLSYPQLSLAQSVFTIASPYASSQSKQTSLTALQDGIRENKMAPLYAYLAHPQTGKINASGESGSAALSPTRSRQSTSGQQSSNTAAGTPSPEHMLRRTSSINTPSIVGVLGGKKDTSVDLPWDEKLYEELKAENEKELAAIQKEEDDAVERSGETEIQNARGKRAEYYAQIGDKDKALEAFEKLIEKTAILGSKIDIVLAIIRIGLFFDDKLLVKKNIDRAGLLVESGGDWDRRNRLKAYQGLHLLTIRAHNLAAPLLLDSLSTFTSTELCPYSSLVVYATLAGAVSLPRRDFKSKVVDAPEIRAIFGSDAETDRLSALAGSASAGPGEGDEHAADTEMSEATTTPKPTAVNLTTLARGSADAEAQALAEPVMDFRPLASMIQSLYSGTYTTFFTSLAAVEQHFLTTDRFLYEHRTWYVREMRLRAYAQLLASYKVVSLESMARSFGVSVEWLDRDLAPFIASERLACRIDRVKGVVETRRSGEKSKQYGDVVRQGDQLITKLQKYGQVVRLRGSER